MKKETQLILQQNSKKLTIQPLKVPLNYVIQCEIFCWHKNKELKYFSAAITINGLTEVMRPTLYETVAEIKEKIWQKISATYEVEQSWENVGIFYNIRRTNKTLMTNYGYLMPK